jgi:endonuclease/exonuclease/phosphatase family metal-dependent hydrolase
MKTIVLALCLALLIPARSAAQTDGMWQTINILSWNIYMRPAGLFWNGQLVRAKHIGELLKDSEYDVLVFQEAFGKKSMKLLREALDGEFPYEILPGNTGKVFNNGLWVVSRLPIENITSIFFDECVGVDCGAAKGAVVFEVAKNGHSYQIVNTHLQSMDGPRQIAVRNSQFAQIEQVLEKEERPGVLQIIAGDLNTSRDNEDAYKEMVTILNAEDGEVCIPENTQLASAEPGTWGCANNSLIPDKWKGQSQLLDYALVRSPKERKRMRPLWVDRTISTFTSQWSKKHKHLSDHYALSISIVHP